VESKEQPPRLQKPLRLTEQVWPEGTKPVVSIWCITYNHANFIRDALEGFLMQETTFPVELLVHDDASIDGTADIIREYQARYPGLLRCVLQVENQSAKKKKSATYLNPLIRGGFVAVCEGDDYWITASKLQAQVNIMQQRPSSVLCGTRCLVVRDGENEPYRVEPDIPQAEAAMFGPQDYLLNKSFVRMPTRLIRTDTFMEYSSWHEGNNFGMDWGMLLFCASKTLNDRDGILFLDEPTAVYREHAGGMHTGASQSQRNTRKLRAVKKFFDFLPHDVHQHYISIENHVRAEIIQDHSISLRTRLLHALEHLARNPRLQNAYSLLWKTVVICITDVKQKIFDHAQMVPKSNRRPNH
jgi:glycosyltransferase involved in cell wall biosynthesis